MIQRLTGLYFLFAFCLATLPVLADDSRPASLTISGEHHIYSVTWKRPIKGKVVPPLDISFDADSQQISPRSIHKSDNAIVERWDIQRHQGLAGMSIVVEGLVGSSYQVLLRIPEKHHGVLTTVLDTENNQFTLPPDPSKLFKSTMLTYLTLGFEHILIGIDHLLFVFALMLLIARLKTLLITVSAFTVAHSLTLIAVSLGWLQIPGPPVEAAIALSIVFLARELVLVHQGQNSLTATYPWMVALAFGLLHGMGFAGALAEIGLPETAVISALLAFNIGVELGQLAFIALILLILKVVKRLKAIPPKLASAQAYFIGIIASIWLLERLTNF